MILDQDKIEKIKGILKSNPKGLTISELSQKVNLNRNSLAKYLEILLVSGQVEMESFGTAKVYYLSRRVPVSALLKFSTDLIVMLDADLQVVQVNDNFLTFFGHNREEIVGMNLQNLPAPLPDLAVRSSLQDLFEEGEIVREFRFPREGKETFLRVKLIPTVFDDGGKGITLIGEDITIQKEYEERLKASEAQYRAIVEDQTELICRRLPDGTINFVNDAYCRYFNLRPENLVGHKFYPSMPLSDLEHRTEMRRRISPGEPVVTYEVRNLQHEGEVRWLQWTDRALYGEGEVLQEYQSVGRDITERREAEQELRIMESAIASSINGIAIFDPDVNLIYANRSFLDLSGINSFSEVSGKHAKNLFPDDPVITEKIGHIYTIIQQDGKWFGDVETTDRAGQPLNLQISVNRVQDKEGGTLCFLASVVNITDQKRMEEAYRSTYGKLQESIEFMPDPTFIVDREKRVVAWNHAMEGFTGMGKEDMLGKSDYRRAFKFYGESRPVLVDLIDLKEEEITKAYPNVRHFGENIFVEAFVPSLNHGKGAYLWGKASRLSDCDGNYIGAIESIRDISDWKKAEESLRRAYETTRSPEQM